MRTRGDTGGDAGRKSCSHGTNWEAAREKVNGPALEQDEDKIEKEDKIHGRIRIVG